MAPKKAQSNLTSDLCEAGIRFAACPLCDCPRTGCSKLFEDPEPPRCIIVDRMRNAAFITCCCLLALSFGDGSLGLSQTEQQTSSSNSERSPVQVRVDAGKPIGPYQPIWNYFGADEPNYVYAANGKKLLGELADAKAKPQAAIAALHKITSKRFADRKPQAERMAKAKVLFDAVRRDDPAKIAAAGMVK